MYQGSCLCGAIRFTVSAPLDVTDICHCTQCRKWTGHVFASVDVPRNALSIAQTDTLTWYASSSKVRRGFCACCGSSVFFDPIDTHKHHWIGIALGAFDAPTHTRIKQHIFVGEKGDYYEITDTLPQNKA